MGTSGPSDGPNPGTPLVPSWLDDAPAATPPADGGAPAAPDGSPDGGPVPVPQAPRTPLPPLPPPPPPDRFRGARSNFSRFAASGGSDMRALRRALRDYVRSGVGGTPNA